MPGLAFLCALLLFGCAGGAPDLTEVREFDAYRVYYAGDDVAGNSLEALEGEEWKKEGSVRWTFYYGECDPSGGPFSDGGCAPPLQIQNYSICRRRPGLGKGKASTFDFRGAKASWRRGRGFEVFTGGTTVVIFATSDALAKAAARQLRDVRDTNSSRTLASYSRPTRQACQQRSGNP